MSNDFQRVKDVKAFLAKRGTRRTGTHNMSKRILSWPYCANCGRVALKNDATRKALKSACVWED